MFKSLVRLSVFILIISGPILADIILKYVSDELIIKYVFLASGLAIIHFGKAGR